MLLKEACLYPNQVIPHQNMATVFILQELNLLPGFASRESTLQGILTGTVGRTPEAPLPNVTQGRILLSHSGSEGREKLLCKAQRNPL